MPLSADACTLIFQSTHPVWGGTSCASEIRSSAIFQSTHPVWGGTEIEADGSDYGNISIHPPRVGWDLKVRTRRALEDHFNPPTPCGVGRWGREYRN